MGIDWSLKNSETNNYLVQTCSYYSRLKFRLAGWLFSRAGTGAVGCACCLEPQLAITKPLRQDLTKDCLLLSDTWIFHSMMGKNISERLELVVPLATYISIFSGLAQNLYNVWATEDDQ